MPLDPRHATLSPGELRAVLEAAVGPLPLLEVDGPWIRLPASPTSRYAVPPPRSIDTDPAEVLTEAKALLALYGTLVELQHPDILRRVDSEAGA